MKIDTKGSNSLATSVPNKDSKDFERNGARKSGILNRLTLRMVLSRGSRLLYFIVGIIAIFAFTYAFGHPLLEAEIKGNDSGYALSIIDWIDRWFPAFPKWYPLQGAGSSSIVAYPYGAHLLVVIAHRLTGIGLAPMFRIFQLASIALTSAGIYVFVWVKLRNQTMALIAGLCYPLSAAAWPWVTDVGLFGQAVSLIYFAPAFLIFDAYLNACKVEQTRKINIWQRIAFPLVSFLFCVMFITHGATGVVFGMTIMAYAILLPLVEQDVKPRVRSVVLNILRAIKVIGVGFAFSAFWLLPYFHYDGLANREGVGGGFALHQIPYLDLLAVIGLREPPEMWKMWSLSFASSVLILAGLGLLLASQKNRLVLCWGIIAVSFTIFTAMPGLWPGFVGIFKKIWANTYVRGLIPTMILLPVLASYGVGEFARLIVDAPSKFVGLMRKNRHSTSTQNMLLVSLKAGVTSILTLVLAYFAFVYLRNSPAGYGTYPGYGATVGAAYWPFDFKGSQVTWTRRPELVISDNDSPPYSETVQAIVEALGLDSSTRIDISPFLGGFVQVLPLYSDVSTINMYSYGANLFHAMWGYQQGSFFSDEFGTPFEIGEFAKWLGIEYVVLNLDQDPIHKYDDTKWSIVFTPEEAHYSRMQVRRFSDTTELANMTNRPTILVIGGYENGIYEQVYRVFNVGAVPYSDALVIEGSHYIDDYALDDLRGFDVLFLHGYAYRNQNRAWELLADYVSSGGSLYVDTGWQYWVPDWELDQAPEVLPIKDLVWTDFGITNEFVIEDQGIAQNVDANRFAPLEWNSYPWSVSYPSQGIREWARPVLKVAGQPLVIVGQYGDGRVIWSGMNLVNHILSNNNNLEEVAFLESLIKWMLPPATNEEYKSPIVQRDHPDSVNFVIQGPIEEGAKLLWKEAHSPDWKAFVEIEGKSTSVPIYRAGPGMMLILLPETNSDQMKVTLQYGFGWRSWVGNGLSILTTVFLIVGVVNPALWSSVLNRIKRFQLDKKDERPEQRLQDLFDAQEHSSVDDHSYRQDGGLEDLQFSESKRASSKLGKVKSEMSHIEDIEDLLRLLEDSESATSSQTNEAERLLSLWRQSREDADK